MDTDTQETLRDLLTTWSAYDVDAFCAQFNSILRAAPAISVHDIGVVAAHASTGLVCVRHGMRTMLKNYLVMASNTMLHTGAPSWTPRLPEISHVMHPEHVSNTVFEAQLGFGVQALDSLSCYVDDRLIDTIPSLALWNCVHYRPGCNVLRHTLENLGWEEATRLAHNAFAWMHNTRVPVPHRLSSQYIFGDKEDLNKRYCKWLRRNAAVVTQLEE